MCRKEMDEYIGWITVIPFTPKDPKDLYNKPYVQLLREAQENKLKNEPYLYIREDCPKDIKNRIITKWKVVYKETKERHKQGIYSSRDLF